MDSMTFQPQSEVHPGEVLVDFLESAGWNQSDLARRAGITPKTISEICNGKASISPPTSIALERVFGMPAKFWINLQGIYDEAEARAKAIARNADPAVATWASKFPLKEMIKRKWIPKPTAQESEANALLKFLSVSSPDSWNSVWTASQVAFRQTHKIKTSIESVSAWIRRVELEAEEIEVEDFDEKRLRQSILDLRALTRLPIDEALGGAAQMICQKAGIALVLVPELPHTGISGCARWTSEKKAIIALTFRYKTDDHVWFTFFHELGHILLHRSKKSFILDNADENLNDNVIDPEMQRFEEEANRFSRETLIPTEVFQRFIEQKTFNNETIHEFSEQVGVGPGIVVGRLQHEGYLDNHQGNKLKQVIKWGIADM